ncbi:phage tail tape measure protein [Glutamicibacter sp. NPDC087344]|uniref:phage tail tape measure protein n=1 Tax=Glutamicibacter sp. NPDC087344 TaxID=3363994 RepID=UPI00382287A3
MALSIGELVGYVGLDTGPADKALDGLQNKMKSPKLAKAAMAGGAIVGAALAAGMANAISEDTAVRAVRATLDPASEEAQKAGNVAGALFAKGYGESAADTGAAAAGVITSIKGMRTATEDEIAKMTGTVMDMASVFELESDRVSQVIGQMITTGLAKDGAEAADLLTATLQKVPKNVREEIIDATDEYGPFFQQLGISGETAMTMLADASAKGMYGIDKTGDALKEFTIRSTDMSKSSGEAYKALGLSQEQMTKDLLAGGDQAEQAFAKIILGLQDMKDPAAQSQAALALFGTPLEDLSTGEIPGFIDQLANLDGGLGDVAGAAQRVTDEIHSGPGAALTEFKNSIMTELGDSLAQVLPYIQPVLDLLIQFAPVLIPLVGIIGLLAGSIMLWAGVQWLLNAALLANPITWIILGIVALIAAIVLLVANWDSVVAWITQIWGGFINWCTGVINGFMGWWNGVWQGFLDFLSGIWTSASEGISSFIDGALQWFRDLPGNIMTALGDMGSLLLDAGKQILRGFLDGLTAGFESVKDFVGGIGSWIADHKGPKQYDLGLLVPAGGWIMDGLESGIEASMPSLGTTLGDVSWMIANGIDPQVGVPTGAGATVPMESGGYTFNVTIEGQEDPETTWQIFKSRANDQLRAQGSDILFD